MARRRKKGNLHISRDFGRCRKVKDMKGGTPQAIGEILDVARSAGCTIKKWHVVRYKPHQGYTLVVTIAESHFVLQTWPERRFKSWVNLDIFICNYTRDNQEIARRLARFLEAFFRPQEVTYFSPRLRGPFIVRRPNN